MRPASLAVLAGIAWAATAMLPAASAAYPEKSIEIILPWPPGTETDVGARVLAQAMAKQLGVPVQVINKPGAAGVIGATEVAKARPDGYMLGSLNIGPLVSQVIAGNTPYRAEDFEPIGLYDSLPYLLLAKTDAPFKNMRELGERARQGGKKIAIGNFGPATVPTLSVHRMAAKDGWKFKSVTYPATNFNQITAGDVDLIIVAYPVIAGHINAGQARALVAMAPRKISALPDVQTVREQGFGFDVSIWSGLFGPKGTPRDVIGKLGAALQAALQDPDVQEFGAKSSIIYSYENPDRTRAQLKADEEGLRPVMDALGLIKK
jgi:tripartite-type tricarboxylate transporter receptor subunit TctC